MAEQSDSDFHTQPRFVCFVPDQKSVCFARTLASFVSFSSRRPGLEERKTADSGVEGRSGVVGGRGRKRDKRGRRTVHRERVERALVLGMWYHCLSQSQAHAAKVPPRYALYYATVWLHISAVRAVGPVDVRRLARSSASNALAEYAIYTVVDKIKWTG